MRGITVFNAIPGGQIRKKGRTRLHCTIVHISHRQTLLTYLVRRQTLCGQTERMVGIDSAWRRNYLLSQAVSLSSTNYVNKCSPYCHPTSPPALLLSAFIASVGHKILESIEGATTTCISGCFHFIF